MSTTLAALLLLSGPLAVPKGTAAKIDGILGMEWKDSKLIAQHADARIFAKHDGKDLYLALEGKAVSIASIQLLRGDQVQILHASAALGSATYAKIGDKWNPGKSFQWACRGMSDAPESLAEQAKFYKENGWLANTAPRAEVREYRISKASLAPMAIALYKFDPEGVVVSLPAKPEDDAFHGKLIGGWQPEGLTFRPQSWVTFRLD